MENQTPEKYFKIMTSEKTGRVLYSFETIHVADKYALDCYTWLMKKNIRIWQEHIEIEKFMQRDIEE